MSAPLLQVRDLAVAFRGDHGTNRVVDGVSFSLRAKRTLGIVGESGCGKSVTALAIMGLLPEPAAHLAAGSVHFMDRDLRRMDERGLRRLRGAELSMIFQEPATALNPVYTVGRQIADVLRRHERLGRRAARSRAVEMLVRVGIPAPERRIDEYPHELSGGMRQRAMIAMALACRPNLLIADEPTTALDVTTQAQVLERIAELRDELDTAVLLITHDLGVVAETCDEALVMYCGRVVEQAPISTLFAQPRHRYTEALLASVPRIRTRRAGRLPDIPGTVPDPGRRPPGCPFAPRCRHASQRCREEMPELEQRGASRFACFHPAPGSDE